MRDPKKQGKSSTHLAWLCIIWRRFKAYQSGLHASKQSDRLVSKPTIAIWKSISELFMSTGGMCKGCIAVLVVYAAWKDAPKEFLQCHYVNVNLSFYQWERRQNYQCLQSHIYIHACTHICRYMHMCNPPHTHMHACMHTHAYMDTYTHIQACIHTHAHARTHAHTHACTHARTHALKHRPVTCNFQGSSIDMLHRTRQWRSPRTLISKD